MCDSIYTEMAAILTITDYQNEVLEEYIVGEYVGVEERQGRRFIRWRFNRGLEKERTPVFMARFREKVHTAFYVRHVYSYQLRNIEDETLITYFKNIGSPWFQRLSEAKKWLSEREKIRLDPDNIIRPDMKWRFENHGIVDVKVVLDRKPLLGIGPLPDWPAAQPCAWPSDDGS